jgi:hypothetical protein
MRGQGNVHRFMVFIRSLCGSTHTALYCRPATLDFPGGDSCFLAIQITQGAQAW